MLKKSIFVSGKNELIVDNLCEIITLFGYSVTIVDTMDVDAQLKGNRPALIILDVPNSWHNRDNLAFIRKVLPFEVPVLIYGNLDDLGFYMEIFDDHRLIHYWKKSASVLYLEKILALLVGSPTAKINR